MSDATDAALAYLDDPVERWIDEAGEEAWQLRALQTLGKALVGQVVELREALKSAALSFEEITDPVSYMMGADLSSAQRWAKEALAEVRAVLSAAGTEVEQEQSRRELADAGDDQAYEDGGTSAVASVPVVKSDRGEGEA